MAKKQIPQQIEAQKINEPKQLLFPGLQEKRISIENSIISKFKVLSKQLHRFSYSQVIWLSRFEMQFIEKGYLSERQCDIIDNVIRAYQLNKNIEEIQ